MTDMSKGTRRGRDVVVYERMTMKDDRYHDYYIYRLRRSVA
jgi:hypothetical protein